MKQNTFFAILIIFFTCNYSCQKDTLGLQDVTAGDFEIIEKDANHFTLINKSVGPVIAQWRIPQTAQHLSGDTVSVYIGSSGNYDVILYPVSNGGIDSVVKQIVVKQNDPQLFYNESDIVVTGWYNDGWNAESHQVYLNHHQLFSEVNPYWYNLGTGLGTEERKVSDGSIYERSYAYTPLQISQVRSKGDLFIPTIGDMDREQVNRIINDNTAKNNLINNLVNKALERNYDGWDLNFENAHERDKQKFSLFVKELGTALKAKGKVLDVTIGGFANAEKESHWIFDYDGLNIPEVRYIKIMAYDQFLAGIPTLNPVGDYYWVIDILDYAIHTRGVNPKKIILGIANYGWSFKQNPANNKMEIIRPFMTYSQYMNIPGFASWYQDWCHELYGEWFVNGVYHAAFFNNANSVAKRLELVNLYGISGVCFWVLGREDQEIYTSKISAILPGSR